MLHASPTDAPHRKSHLTGTHRLVPPEATLARVRPLMPVMGITRIADVTGLDTIGVPVVMVTRPNARSLAVSQGKGLTLAAAQASGLMESVEHWHAEHIDLPVKLASFNELRFTHRMVDVTALPRLSVSTFHPNLRTLWIEGRSLIDGHATWVPYEMAHMSYALPLPPGSGSFLMSSNGLASGNHVLEATIHGICELVERDATTLFRFSGEAAQAARRVDLATVDDPACRQVLARYESAGIDAFVWETTSDIGIPVFQCTIVDSEPHAGRPIGPMGGMGCHPSRGIALLRALTEAAQSRLTLISGARDDVTFGRPDPGAVLDSARQTLVRRRGERAARGFREAPSFESERFEDDVAFLLDRLRERGLGEVVTVDLSKPMFGIAVVRVILPGLEPLADVPGYVPGNRARAQIGRAAA